MKSLEVQYQIASYSGVVDVLVPEDWDREQVIAFTERLLSKKYGPLPFGSRSFIIMEV